MKKYLKKRHESLPCKDLIPDHYLETLRRGNASIDLKIYDKRQELIDTCPNGDPKKQLYETLPDLMRIEFSLKKASKIDKWLGTCAISRITDEDVCEAFFSHFESYLQATYQAWQEDNHKFLCKVIKNTPKATGSHWRDNLLTGFRNHEIQPRIIELLDIEDYYAAEKESLTPYRKHMVSLQEDDPFSLQSNRKTKELFATILSPWYQSYDPSKTAQVQDSKPSTDIPGGEKNHDCYRKATSEAASAVISGKVTK